MTRSASNLVEEFGTFFGQGSFRELRVARGSFCRSHKAREVIDIGEPVRTWRVIWLGSGIAELCHLVRKEPIRDSHFIEIGIARKREQPRVLILPTDPPNASLSGGFHDGNIEHLAADFAVRGLALVAGKINQSLVGDRFDEAVAQEIQRDARGPYCFGVGDTLLNLRVRERPAWTNGAKIHERAGGDGLGSMSDGDFRVLETLVRSQMPDAQFGDLAGAARCWILMAFAAGLGVVKRTKPVI